MNDGEDGTVAPPTARRAARLAARWRAPVARGAWLVVTVALVGVIVTGVLSWSAWRLDRSSEHRLLLVQTRQAANVVSAAIVGIESPVQTAAELASVTGGNAQIFVGYVAPLTGVGGPFVMASLWRVGDGDAELLASYAAPGVAVTGVAQQEVAVQRAARASSFVVVGVTIGSLNRIAYAVAAPAAGPTVSSSGPGRYVAYVERAVPADRRAPVASNSAFADLHYATYLGATVSAASLETTDLPLSRLPLSGDTDRVVIPFGDTSLTLVTSPSRHLGSQFGQQLWWLLLAGGLVLSAAATVVTGRLVAQRRRAETDTATIGRLYEQLDAVYLEQRTVSHTLQQALLPQSNPTIRGLEIATRYLAGAHGVEVGGDWYSVIELDNEHFGFVVGDVSGRGINAATLMARVRFILTAYLAEGHPPSVALDLTAPHVDLRTDKHLVTVLVGVGDLRTGRVTFASAGHLPPVLFGDGPTRYVDVAGGTPLGVATTTSYPSTHIVVTPGASLLAFTDGLIERRGENIDIGLRRLQAAVTGKAVPLDGQLTRLLADIVDGDSEDDIALLAVRWRLDALAVNAGDTVSRADSPADQSHANQADTNEVNTNEVNANEADANEADANQADID